MLEKALAKVEPNATTKEKLLAKLQIQWAQISQQVSINFFRSMMRSLRLRECTTRRDGHPHYWSHFCHFFHAPLPDWTDLLIWYEQGAESFLCVFVSQYSKVTLLHTIFRFIFLFIFKEIEINFNIPNFCPPVYLNRTQLAHIGHNQ